MLKLARSIVSVLARRFRSRATLELENLALRHQLRVLRRQRPGRPWLFAVDRLLWIWLCRLWPGCLEVMVLVKPATVVQWHRQGFRLFWRWRSRSGRPSVDREIRDLIRQMSSANPLWGAPRIHGELAQARHRGQSSYGRQVHGAKTRCAFPDLAELPARSGRRHRCNRYVRCGIRFVSAALRYDHSGARSKEDRTHSCNRPSDRCLALAPGNRSVPVEHGSPVSAARSRCVVWLVLLQPS